ncbi:Sister chromatid cohesion 1 protein 4 [Zea mays]|uniref:Sister chromatid cohesion 1 protein 4 n=1 Tax=Zea mays TaxID=4577 RepID=A0A1D6N4L8_MAIZE|nr:Sister chromatid cohesion 1 protein 4 [Zea mays]
MIYYCIMRVLQGHQLRTFNLAHILVMNLHHQSSLVLRPQLHHTSEGLPSQGQADHLEPAADKLVNSDGIAASVETVTVNATIKDVPLAVNDSEPCVDGSTEPSVVENLVQINGPLIDAQGTITQIADFQHEAQAMQQVVASNDRLNELATSEFAEPEKMLSVPDSEFNHPIDLGLITAEKGTTESDGSNIIGSLASRKRHLEDSLPALESETTERLSSRPHGIRTNDFVPHDDDILASILVGRRTPGFTLDSTPLPPRESSLKRRRLGSKMGTLKRKVQIDDAMVLHADTIRQQLINTEDIRRIRKKAPCTRSEIWMIEKGSLEDDIFHEPIFSCLSEELNKLHNRTYEAIVHPAVQNMELQGQLDMPEAITEDSNIAGFGAATIDGPLHIPDGIQSDAMLPRANDAYGATAAFSLQVPPNNQVNGASNDFVIGTLFQGVTGPFIGNEKEVALADRERAQVNTLYSDHFQDVPSDLHSTDANISSQDVSGFPRPTEDENAVDYNQDASGFSRPTEDVQDASGFPRPTEDENMVDYNQDASGFPRPTEDVNAVGYNQDASGFARPTEDVNAVGCNQDASGFPRSMKDENAVEYNQDGSGFPRPAENENDVSAMGDNSGFHENNMGSLTDLDMVNDYELKESNDFGSAINGVDTDFLNYDDDDGGDFDDANDDEPNPNEFQSLDNSGWSSRTRGVARYLKALFDDESGLERKSVAIDHLVRGKTRKEASRMFFETLVLTTKDYISVDQPNPFDLVRIKPGSKLLMSEF